MQVNTVMVVKNSANPQQQIVLNSCDCDSENADTNTNIDYDTLSAAEKTQFDDCMAMLESKIPV